MGEEKGWVEPSKVRIWRSDELRTYVVPNAMRGRVVASVEELLATFPADETYGQAYSRTTIPKQPHTLGYTIYSRDNKLRETPKKWAKQPLIFHSKEINLWLPPSRFINVAYGCGACGKIVIGPPRLTPVENNGSVLFWEGLLYECKECLRPIHARNYRLNPVETVGKPTGHDRTIAEMLDYEESQQED